MRARNEKGFTLIEVLVVILIIAVLAAIALPAFLGHREKAQDASAKADARNLVTLVQACFTTRESYDPCTNATLRDSGIPLPAADGAEPAEQQASVIVSTPSSFEIHAKSSSGVMYSIAAGIGLAPVRTCAPVDVGGCPVSGSW